ncbi:ABC transporter substrate-binding protein [Clostridium tyrobutyricum]|uniref:ABC transporter substrate-binding protein n=1 Tax=Clostridium tyrobutyricum TaxID=1519 RepID=UPI0020CF6745|nr:ABC transporter substrate-binding protein [Clostridium tyrobutyricum]
MQINADKNDAEVTKHKGNRYIKFTKQLINYLLFPILILVIWELISRLQVVPSILLPSIEDVVKSFILQIKSGQLINDLVQSLIRVFKGYFIAVILGISTGIIMGISEKTNKFFTIVFNGISQNKIYSTIVVKNDSKIKTLKDLKGKKIGFAKGTYAQKFLLEILSKNGISDKDVQLVNVTTDAESSLISGNLDALVLTDDSALQLTAVKKVARNIVSSRQYPEMSAQSIVVVRSDYAKQNSKVPVAIDKALIEAGNYFKSNPEDSYKLLTKAGLSLEAVKQQYSGEAPDFNVLKTEINQDTIKRLDKTQKFLLDNNLITNKFDTASWADKSYYQKAVK